MDNEDFMRHEIELCMKDPVYYVESILGHKINGYQKKLVRLLWEDCLDNNRINLYGGSYGTK